MSGVTWTDRPATFTGTFDGTTFTLTEPPRPYEWPVRPIVPASDACRAEIAPVGAAIDALDHDALGIQLVLAPSPFGPCVALVSVTLDTPALRAALAPVAGRYELMPLFTPVG